MTSTFTLNHGSVAVILNPSERKIDLSFGDFKFKCLCLALLIDQSYFVFCVDKILRSTILKIHNFFLEYSEYKNSALTCGHL